MNLHDEKSFEAEIEAHLLAHGYESGSSAGFDRDKAIFPGFDSITGGPGAGSPAR